MRISKKQLRRIIREENRQLLREQHSSMASDEGSEDYPWVEDALSDMNTKLYSALPAIEEIIELIDAGKYEPSVMNTLIDQINEFTFDAFGEYLIDKRKLSRIKKKGRWKGHAHNRALGKK